MMAAPGGVKVGQVRGGVKDEKEVVVEEEVELGAALQFETRPSAGDARPDGPTAAGSEGEARDKRGRTGADKFFDHCFQVSLNLLARSCVCFRVPGYGLGQALPASTRSRLERQRRTTV
jgi:hypothetical protein